ncbi:hypothetical protein FB567DRAFT_334682 [Paraphoma chrysanthemicola]|uniref:2EXR domain-containing protein n=1 Tax=Paraphoma chrysanthemicola TaxID=798071 RepID=A0A8K0RA36_9PLEO|nr:hypothetical protein FB567DRAFT_334682 [Paraphoma chrysanthemicola]
MANSTSDMAYTTAQKKGSEASPFLRLPFEIRLMIYEYLLHPSVVPSTGTSTSLANLMPDFHTYYSEDTNNDPFTLSVRTMDPWMGSQGSRSWRRRSTYHIRTDETRFINMRRMTGSLLTCMQGPFLTTTTPTTYRILLSPYTAHLRHNVPSLLALNQQIHAEASKVLYSTYSFSFHTSIEAAVPFLNDLTPVARNHIRHLSFTKKALPYTKEFDRAEWSALCEYIALHHAAAREPNPNVPDALGFTLRSLHLNIIGGKPDIGWDDIAPITAADYNTMVRMRNEWGGGSAFGGVDLEWAEQLMEIKGLGSLQVKALVEHCPRPVSEKLAFWVAFSKSVEEGVFGEWLGGNMVEV